MNEYIMDQIRNDLMYKILKEIICEDISICKDYNKLIENIKKDRNWCDINQDIQKTYEQLITEIKISSISYEYFELESKKGNEDKDYTTVISNLVKMIREVCNSNDSKNNQIGCSSIVILAINDCWVENERGKESFNNGMNNTLAPLTAENSKELKLMTEPPSELEKSRQKQIVEQHATPIKLIELKNQEHNDKIFELIKKKEEIEKSIVVLNEEEKKIEDKISKRIIFTSKAQELIKKQEELNTLKEEKLKMQNDFKSLEDEFNEYKAKYTEHEEKMNECKEKLRSCK